MYNKLEQYIKKVQREPLHTSFPSVMMLWHALRQYQPSGTLHGLLVHVYGYFHFISCDGHFREHRDSSLGDTHSFVTLVPLARGL